MTWVKRKVSCSVYHAFCGTMTVVAANFLFLPTSTAQGPPPQDVIFHVQFLQLTRASADAIAARRVDTAPDFFGAPGMNLHIFRQDAALDALLSTERTGGGLELLAVPQLRTTVGSRAIALIGGNYPIPTLPADNPAGALAPSPEFGSRDFGIRLSFRPFLESGAIRLQTQVLIQTADFGHSTTRRGRIVPGISVQQLQSQIEVRPGQSFAITGVLSDEVVQRINRLPELAKEYWIKELLERRTRQPDRRFVMIVTPQLVTRGGRPG